MSDGVSGRWLAEARPVLEATLGQLGYDIDPPRPGHPPVGGLVARRDRGERVTLLAVDAGGRFRAEITWLVGEWPSRDVIGGVPVRVVDGVSRAVTITGQAQEARQMVEFIIALENARRWTGPSEASDASMA